MAEDVIEKGKMFCYLENVLWPKSAILEAVAARIRAGCKRFKNVTCVLCKKSLLVKLRNLYIKYIYQKCNELQRRMTDKGKHYKENGVHPNKNASNDKWHDTEG